MAVLYTMVIIKMNFLSIDFVKKLRYSEIKISGCSSEVYKRLDGSHDLLMGVSTLCTLVVHEI